MVSIKPAAAQASPRYWRCQLSRLSPFSPEIRTRSSAQSTSPGVFIADVPHSDLRVLPNLGHMCHYFAAAAIIDAIRGAVARTTE